MTKFKETPQVYLVGAGPGDPELLTVKALRVIKSAEILIYDRLVSEEIVELASPQAQRIFVGKADGFHPVPQGRINALLVGLARSGGTVVRLKGGDPFVFGRGSEEAEELRRYGIPFEVIPGITAASGCLAEIGIPLTHRDLATGVRLVTGHRCGDGPLDLNWKSLADPDTTLVLYMALANLPEISASLIAAGLPANTPAAAVCGGTTPKRRMCTCALADLPTKVEEAGIVAPALVVIGRVAALAEPNADRRAEAAEDSVWFVREAGHA